MLLLGENIGILQDSITKEYNMSSRQVRAREERKKQS